LLIKTAITANDECMRCDTLLWWGQLKCLVHYTLDHFMCYYPPTPTLGVEFLNVPRLTSSQSFLWHRLYRHWFAGYSH